MRAHVEEYSEYHLSKTWSELQNTKQELIDVTREMKKIEEIKNRVETLQSENDDMEFSLQRNKEEISDLKLSEKKLEVENMSLRKEVNELGRQLAEMKTNAATENRSLRELLQSMQKKLDAIEKKEAEKIIREEKIAEVTINFTYSLDRDDCQLPILLATILQALLTSNIPRNVLSQFTGIYIPPLTFKLFHISIYDGLVFFRVFNFHF